MAKINKTTLIQRLISSGDFCKITKGVACILKFAYQFDTIT